jgi:hypothetical protein
VAIEDALGFHVKRRTEPPWVGVPTCQRYDPRSPGAQWYADDAGSSGRCGFGASWRAFWHGWTWFLLIWAVVETAWFTVGAFEDMGCLR